VNPYRARIIDWEDPLPLAALGATRDGLDLMKAVARGELPPPPIAKLLGMRIPEVEEGRVVFSLEPAEFHYNPIGTVHGGIAATLLDSATGCAVHTTLPAGVGYTTLELKVNYVRPILASTGTVLAEGKVVHRGGTVATAEGRLTAASDGTLLAHGSATLLLMGSDSTARKGARALKAA
jgi:uncharacterized protein (TIGR00369 family)